MRPFNLEEALAGKPVVNSDNQPVFVTKLPIRMFNDGELLVQDKNGYSLGFYTASGKLITSNITYIYMAEVRRTIWLNLYTSNTHIFSSETEADLQALPGRVDGRAFPIIVTDGSKLFIDTYSHHR